MRYHIWYEGSSIVRDDQIQRSKGLGATYCTQSGEGFGDGFGFGNGSGQNAFNNPSLWHMVLIQYW